MEDKGEHEHRNPTETSKSFWKKAGLAISSGLWLTTSGLTTTSAGFALAIGNEHEALLKGALAATFGAVSLASAFQLGRETKK